MLCVDDNRDSADLEAILLDLSGFDTKVCYDGESALLAAREYKPDVCVIDLNMPGMEGDVLAVRLRQEMIQKPTGFIALTAMSNEKAANRIKNAGFHAHLVKPVDPDMFIEEVERLCHEVLS